MEKEDDFDSILHYRHNQEDEEEENWHRGEVGCLQQSTQCDFSQKSWNVQLGFILSPSLHTGDKAAWASVRASVLLLSFPVCTCTMYVHVWMYQQV